MGMSMQSTRLLVAQESDGCSLQLTVTIHEHQIPAVQPNQQQCCEKTLIKEFDNLHRKI